MTKRKPATPHGLQYIKEWDAQNSVRVSLKLSRTADADIIEWLDQQASKNSAIKQSIRDTITASRIKPSEG